MKRSVIAALAVAIATIAAAPAFADTPDFRTDKGRAKFWEEQATRGNGRG